MMEALSSWDKASLIGETPMPPASWLIPATQSLILLLASVTGKVDIDAAHLFPIDLFLADPLPQRLLDLDMQHVLQFPGGEAGVGLFDKMSG